MNPEADKLYNLLPALYRLRDVEHGGVLKALCDVIAAEIAVLRENLDQLYDDQFIETCADWLVPYIGDLIGYRTLHGVTARTRSARAEVANTIAYRRRKGTATVLEQLARDVTGWPARVAEMFQHLGWTQHMNHIRPESRYAPDLRQWEKLERLNTPFDSISHSVDVRGIAKGQGKYNIPNIGVFLWRLRAYRLHGSPAVPAAPGDAQRFLFDPLAMERQLFTRDEAELEISHLAEPINAPVPLSRRVLANFLDRYYGEHKSLFIAGAALATVQICNLSDSAGGWAHTPPPAGKIAIDPVLGRIACGDVQAQPPQVTFHYGFSADMGAGEYDRAATLTEKPTAAASVPIPNATIQAALAIVQPAGGVAEITDSGRYVETPVLNAATATKVELRGANERRPTLVLGGAWEIAGGDQAEVTLDGLLITGGALRVSNTPGNQLRHLRLRHCTLVPGAQPALVVDIANVTVEIDHCIVGPLRVAAGSTIRIANSMVDATEETNVAYCGTESVPAGQPEADGGAVEILNSTIIGKVRSGEFKLVANSIFVAALAAGDNWLAPVRSEKKQSGCVRFSYLPPGALTPRRYRCQPDFEIATRIDLAEKAAGGPIGATQVNAIRADVSSWLAPSFSTLRYGLASYGQLRLSCPAQIRAGADDEAEMGAFHDLYQPQRETNLRVRLDEYLRFGLEAGVFYDS